MSEEIKQILAALAKAQGEFPDIPKARSATVRGKNKQTGEFYEYTYAYADFADVLKAIRPILAKHELSLTQPIRRKELKLHLTTQLFHVSGEFIESDGLPIPEIMNPQELGSLLSYWRRYDACALLGIQPDEDDDARRAALASGKKGNLPRNEAKIEAQSQAGKPLARDIRAFWAAINSSGKKPAEIKAWLREKRYLSVEEIPEEQMSTAIRWASGAPEVADDLVGVLQQSVEIAERAKTAKQSGIEAAAAVLKPPTVKSYDHAWPKLYAKAKEKNIPREDVKRFYTEQYGVASGGELTPLQFAEVVKWVSEVG